jgi:Holliday junction resolvase RusA-like endonuclease
MSEVQHPVRRTSARKSVVIHDGLPGLNEQLAAKGNTYVAKGSRRRSAYTAMKKKYTDMVAAELRLQGCVPDEPYQTIMLSIIWYMKDRRMDPDNISAGKKFLLDGMTSADVIENDGFKNIASIKERFCVSEDKRHRVEASWEVLE